MTSKRSGKRKARFRLLIYPSFQIDLILRMLILAVILIGILYLSQWYFFHSYWSLAKQLGLSEGHVFFRFLEDQKKMLDLIFLATSLVMLSIIGGTALVLSHRVAGPLIRIQQYLDRSPDGKYRGPLKFRRKDYFTEIAQSLNAYLHAKPKSSGQEDP